MAVATLKTSRRAGKGPAKGPRKAVSAAPAPVRIRSNPLAGITCGGGSGPGPSNPVGKSRNPDKHSPIKIQNRVRVRVVGPDGKVKAETPWVNNILTTFGLASLASMVGSSAGVQASTWISSMRIGTHTATPVSTGTALGASTAAVHITAASLTKTNLGNRTVEYQATFASNNPAGTCVVNEVGLYCNSTADSQMAAHSTLGASSVNKGASDTINISHQIIWTTA